MKKILLCWVILYAGTITHVYAQAKKPPVKKVAPINKPAVSKTKTPVKTNPAVNNKVPLKNKPVGTAKNMTKPVKPVNKTEVTTPVLNKQVNNSEITKATLTSREEEMINEINLLRLNPANYCSYVEAYLQKHDADNEVIMAAKELVSILKKMKPLNPLILNASMYHEAKQYGLSMVKKNVIEHSTLPYAENLSLGHKDIRDAIIDLLIDEGMPGRGHRKNLLNERIKHVAVFELPGKVQDIGYCYVQEFK